MELRVSGSPQELDFVLRICRDKVRRGLLEISVPDAPPASDSKEINLSDSKEIEAESKARPKKRLK